MGDRSENLNQEQSAPDDERADEGGAQSLRPAAELLGADDRQGEEYEPADLPPGLEAVCRSGRNGGDHDEADRREEILRASPGAEGESEHADSAGQYGVDRIDSREWPVEEQK